MTRNELEMLIVGLVWGAFIMGLIWLIWWTRLKRTLPTQAQVMELNILVATLRSRLGR